MVAKITKHCLLVSVSGQFSTNINITLSSLYIQKKQDIPTDTIVDQAEQVINPEIDTVSDRPENSEVIKIERRQPTGRSDIRLRPIDF